MEVYQAETGQLLFRRQGEAPPIYDVIQEQISAEVLAPGRYLYVCMLSRNKETLVTKKERFEIRLEMKNIKKLLNSIIFFGLYKHLTFKKLPNQHHCESIQLACPNPSIRTNLKPAPLIVLVNAEKLSSVSSSPNLPAVIRPNSISGNLSICE